ncbi:MAG: 30S ribosomal protein S3ae [Candidatus Micrarchaeota archaeon]
MVKGRTVDKWKTKSWYTVYAPEILEGKEIGKVPASEDKALINRIIKISLAELTGDFSQTYTSVQFRIHSVKGKSAQTYLIGHELARGYLKTLVRRGRTVLNVVQDVVTKDGVVVRVKTVAFTVRRVSTPIAKAIRAEVDACVSEKAKEMTFSQLEQEIIFGKFSSRIFNRVKKIVPMRRVEIRKTEVLVKK